jgi:hypothetical protein
MVAVIGARDEETAEGDEAWSGCSCGGGGGYWLRRRRPGMSPASSRGGGRDEDQRSVVEKEK